ncbi:myosin-13-like isoform X3 [Bolinopsis microptera]|uniref:myosin-13-like isoform X3 n=1 Tax=Bolinopsis microptera TaxID=2820187 RepID=UPI003079FE36
MDTVTSPDPNDSCLNTEPDPDVGPEAVAVLLSTAVESVGGTEISSGSELTSEVSASSDTQCNSRTDGNSSMVSQPSNEDNSSQISKQSPSLDKHSHTLEEQSPTIEEHSPTLVEQSPTVEQHSPTVLEEHSPTVLEEHSPTVEQHSPTLVEQSPTLVEPSPTLVEQSPTLVEQSPTLEEHSPTLVEQLPTLVEMSPTLEEHSPTLVEQSPTLEEHSPTLVEQSPTLEEHSPTLEEHSPTLVEQSPTLVEQSPTVVEQSPTLVEQSPTLVEQSPSTLVEQSPTLVEQSPTLEEHSPTVAVEEQAPVSENSELDSGSESPGEVGAWSDSEISRSLDLTLSRRSEMMIGQSEGSENSKVDDENGGKESSEAEELTECAGSTSSIDSFESVKSGLPNEDVPLESLEDDDEQVKEIRSSATMQRRDDTLLKQEIDDLKKKLKGAEKANLTLTLAIEEQTKQRNALQENIDELQNALNASINTISRIEYENKTLTRDNEKLAETYTRQRGDLDELRKEWVAEMDRCTTLESGYNSLNQTIVESIRSVVKLLKPAISFTSFDPSVCLPLEDWTTFLNNEFLGATKVVEEIRLNGGSITTTGSDVILPKKSTEVQTDPITFTTDSSMKGNLARSSCFEESRSYSDTSTAPNGGVKAALPAAKPSSATTNGGAAVAVVEEPVQSSDKEDITTEFQFTTDVAALSKRSIEGEFQAIILSFENDTFTLQKRLTMHDRALQKASTSFKTEVDKIQELLTALKSDFLPEDKKRQAEDLSRTLSLLPETVETLTNSSLATGKCQQEEKNVRHFEVMVAHNFHTKKALTGALALCNTNTDLGMPKKDVDRAAVRKKTLAVAAAMRKDEEKQKQMQASEHSSVFSSFAGVVKNLMVKTPAEPDLANRRATEMMQRMKTVETLGADKEALYKEGYRGGLSSGLHDTFDNIKKEQRSCDEGVDSLNKRASRLEREVAFYKKHSNHLFYGGAATPAATLRTIFCTVFINLLVLFILLITVPLPEHSGYTLGTGYISLQEFITSHFLHVPDRDKPLL